MLWPDPQGVGVWHVTDHSVATRSPPSVIHIWPFRLTETFFTHRCLDWQTFAGPNLLQTTLSLSLYLYIYPSIYLFIYIYIIPSQECSLPVKRSFFAEFPFTTTHTTRKTSFRSVTAVVGVYSNSIPRLVVVQWPFGPTNIFFGRVLIIYNVHNLHTYSSSFRVNFFKRSLSMFLRKEFILFHKHNNIIFTFYSSFLFII